MPCRIYKSATSRVFRTHDVYYDHVRISTKCPSIAAATAMAGDTRCVLPPAPCRPSKFLLLVDAHRSPG